MIRERNWEKRMIVIMLLAVLSLCMTVRVDATTTHDISSGNVTCDGGEHKITGSTSKYHVTIKGSNPVVTISNTTIDMSNENDDDKSIEAAAISVEEGCNATLIVEGNNRLEGGNDTGIGKNCGYAGINIEKGASLTIKGESGAVLTVYGGGDHSGAERGGAAIGSDEDNDMGNLTIEGNLTINAYGAVEAAGIGSGFDEMAGNITINGGNIYAQGGRYAAGIGAGNSVGSGDGGTTQNITINGGTIEAVGGAQAAGIGGSDEGDVTGTIKITGGTIVATGGNQGAGIGGGKEGYTNAIQITGGTIAATGGQWAAGIGGGNAVGSGDGGDIGTLEITGGTITATGGGSEGEGGAGIGGSDGGEVGSLKIEEKSENSLYITAQGGKWGAGIGSAAEGTPSHNIPSIYIKLNGGTIHARGGEEGAGIGGGNTSADKIEIYGEGTIHATGVQKSCAIGAGECEDGGIIIIEGDYGAASYDTIDDENSRALQITATIEGQNGSAIVGAADSGGDDITIKNATVTLVDNTNGDKLSAMIGNADNHTMTQKDMGDIIIENCKIIDTKNASKRIGATIGAGNDSEVDNITIKMTSFDGGTIGGTNNSNEVFKQTSIDSITIESSKINATNESDQMKAAIGSGCFASIDEITIKNSEVAAYTKAGAGIGSAGYHYEQSGDPFKWTEGECGDVTILNSKVTATGGKGGAGIGGGWGTSVDDIKIEYSVIEAKAINATDGAAGIGGGHSESCGNIQIKSSKVTAEGGSYSAGIGSSGFSTIYTTLWNATCQSIWINNSAITANGGLGGAGIGTGYGAQFGNDTGILINNSSVTSTGGEGGAGIGAGADGALGSGGQMGTIIYLCGDSQIEARGGEGGAGIGGGVNGGADQIIIDLLQTTYDEGKGDWTDYVKAYGGGGAAGIGAGGIHERENQVFTPSGQDLEKLIVKSGYVYAKGGDEVDNDGAGAGIGGGAHAGNLKEFDVYGGYIVADGGEKTYGASDGNIHHANDIGYGGVDLEPLQTDGDATIYGGTVIGNFSTELDLVIKGGSVRYSSTKTEVENGSGENVYRTIAQIGKPYCELQKIETNVSDYETNDIFSDEFGKVYLHLPESEKDQSTMDCMVNKENRHYYGTTTIDGDGWIKMAGSLQINEPETEPVIGTPFVLTVGGDALADGTEVEFALSGDHIEIVQDGTSTSMPGAQVQLRATDWTEYTVTAVTNDDSYDNEMYWGAEGSYSGKVTRKQGTIAITEDISKVYDGETVEDPSVTIDSDADQSQVIYEYYDADGKIVNGKPVNAGTYKVKASIPETDQYTKASTELVEFIIEKKPITIELSASEEDVDAVITARLSGYVGTKEEQNGQGLGQIAFQVGSQSESKVEDVTRDTSGEYVSSVEFSNVAAKDYLVKADLVNADNYVGVPAEKTFKKNLSVRTIEIDPVIRAVYGDNALQLKDKIHLKDADGREISLPSGESYQYEVVYRAGNDKYEEAISVKSSGEVQIKNAGLEVVKITLEESAAASEAVAYTTILVKRANLVVTPYAYDANDSEKEHVTEVTYGTLDKVAYDLDCEGLVKGDEIDSFTKGYGTIEVEPFNVTTGVGTYVLGINKVPAEGKNLFLSRNYSITVSNVQFEILPALLYVTADDQSGKYGVEPEFTYHFGNEDGYFDLMPWDKPEDVIESVGLKSGKSYAEYEPGLYKDVIEVTLPDEEDQQNYIFKRDGQSTVKNGNLVVKKGDVTIEATVSSKVYNGKSIDDEEEKNVTIAVHPVHSDNIKEEALQSCDTEITYYQIVESNDEVISNTTLVKLDKAPIDAGNYVAKIVAAGTDTNGGKYYNKAEKQCTFTIYKAFANPQIPVLPDMEMKEGLTLADQKLPTGWTWVNPDQTLDIGRVDAKAVYDQDEVDYQNQSFFNKQEKKDNYYNAVKTISFNVYDGSVPVDPGDGSDPGDNPGSNDGSDSDNNPSQNSDSTGANDADTAYRTGDDSNMIPLAFVSIIMFGVLVGVVSFRKRKE